MGNSVGFLNQCKLGLFLSWNSLKQEMRLDREQYEKITYLNPFNAFERLLQGY